MSTPAEQFDAILSSGKPVLALAPMQDVTDWAFWKLIQSYGGADVYYTEYFRVHADSRLERHILKSIADNPTGQPGIAQMIGNDIPSLVRSAKELQRYPIVAVDLNLGCPAPIVYRKCAGGGLLRELPLVDRILGALRDAIDIKFTVKTRIGFDDPAVFDALLPILAKHHIDLLTVHGRTVKEMYRSAVHYEYIAQAVDAMSCPVLANGNVYSADKGMEVLAQTKATGLMIGRGAIRNPWLFQQIRQRFDGQPLSYPTGREVLQYVDELYHAVTTDDVAEVYRIQKMKKYLNYLGLAVEPTGSYLHDMRMATSYAAMMDHLRRYLDHDTPLTLEPFEPELKERDVLAGVHH